MGRALCSAACKFANVRDIECRCRGGKGAKEEQMSSGKQDQIRYLTGHLKDSAFIPSEMGAIRELREGQ